MNIRRFDEALERREKKYWENRVKWSKSEAETVTSGTAEGTTQLVKPRPPYYLQDKSLTDGRMK